MGVKRPLGEENLPELSFKQPKQIDDNNQMYTFVTQDLPSQTAVPRLDFPGEARSNFCELQFDGRLEDGETPNASVAEKDLEDLPSQTAASKIGSPGEEKSKLNIDRRLESHETNGESTMHIDFEASAPFSSGPSTSDDEEDAGDEDSSFLHSFPEYTDFNIPCQVPQPYEDPYVFFLNSAPKKQVPMGPDYQAELPNWNFTANEKIDFSAPNNREQNQSGTCIIPMPDSNNSKFDGSAVGHGRTDCSCPDAGSMRCVQQHVNEEREKLQESIGDELLKELGFDNMGEEVSCNWTSDEEKLFHDVIFSNPASHGRDFWEHLSFVFSNRTNKEIVSYYFNVFMLQRRALQNRSYLLQIDSDDDEEHESARGVPCPNVYLHNQENDDDYEIGRSNENFIVVGEEDEDLALKSIIDEDLDVGWVDDYGPGPGPENVGGEEGDGGEEIKE